jgi:hypothetical protein
VAPSPGGGSVVGSARRAPPRCDALARALADPSLEVAYRADDGWVDLEGEPFVLPSEGAGRAVTPIERDSKPVAMLVHDPEILSDPGIADAVARATRLAAANARLQRDARAQAAELEASRRRTRRGDGAAALERRLREGPSCATVLPPT